MRIEAGIVNYAEGFKFVVNKDIPAKKTIPSGTATHEAMHVVAAIQNGTGVESATIIPGTGYLGLTKLAKPDAVAAMAPHSMGASGTGYDVYIAGIIGNAGHAQSAARSIISSHMEEVEAVAIALEEKKSVGSGDIKKAIYDVTNPRPEEATLFIENDEGKVIKERVEVRDNIVLPPEQLIEIFSSKPQIH